MRMPKEQLDENSVPIQNSYSTRVGTLKDKILAGPEHSDDTKEKGSKEKEE